MAGLADGAWMRDVLIVGAGPAGLACALTLACHGEAGSEHHVEVVDPSGDWLTAWDHRCAAQAIPHLRSPAVHHPHPEPFALLEHARGQGLVPSGGTQLPTTACFSGFVRHTIHRARLDRVLTATKVAALELDASGRPRRGGRRWTVSRSPGPRSNRTRSERHPRRTTPAHRSPLRHPPELRHPPRYRCPVVAQPVVKRRIV